GQMGKYTTVRHNHTLCTHTHTYTHAYTHAYTHTHIHAYTHASPHTTTHTYTHTHAHTHIHTHIHARTHTHAWWCNYRPKPPESEVYATFHLTLSVLFDTSGQSNDVLAAELYILCLVT